MLLASEITTQVHEMPMLQRIQPLKQPLKQLVNEMLDQLPKSVWRSKTTTFFDPAIGGGQFVAEIERRLRAAGHSDENIKSRVFGFEYSLALIDIAINMNNLVGTYKKILYEDFFEWNTDMKFDVVVGNPPYLKGTWLKFLKKVVTLTTRISMISPDGTNNFSTGSHKFVEFLKKNGIQTKTDVTNFFPDVESGKIVVYNLNLTVPYKSDALVDNSIDGQIVSKVIGRGGKKLQAILSSKRGKDTTTRFDKAGNGRIKNLESVTKSGAIYSWINEADTTIIDADNYWLVNRYFGKNSDDVIIEETGRLGIGCNILAIQRIPGWSASDFKKVYLSSPIRFVLQVLRKGGFDTSPRHLAQIPIIAKSNKTDEAICKLFDISFEYVKANVK